MKKFLSLLLTICMLFSMTTIVLAEGYQSKITFEGVEKSYYEVTVPATLKPGGSGSVNVEGVLFHSEKLTVSAPNKVTLTEKTNGITKNLGVVFDSFTVYGSMAGSIDDSKTIKIEDFSVNFGSWEGIINYSVVLDESDEIPANGVYYANKSHASHYSVKELEIGNYDLTYLTYVEGNHFPIKPELGDVYVYDNYEYKYNYFLNSNGVWEQNKSQNGWGVAEISSEHTEEVLTTICDMSVIS